MNQSRPLFVLSRYRVWNRHSHNTACEFHTLRHLRRILAQAISPLQYNTAIALDSGTSVSHLLFTFFFVSYSMISMTNGRT